MIILDFDGFLNKKDIMRTKWCFSILFFVISLKKVWKFGYLVFFVRITFGEFVLAKNFTRISFRKLSKICEIRVNYFPRKLLLLK